MTDKVRSKQRALDEQETTARSRRRLIIAGLVAVGVLAVCCLIAVRSRPLNLTERRLVGAWRDTTLNVTFTLNSDRTVSGGSTPHPPVQWYVRNGRLYFSGHPIEEAIRSLLRPQYDGGFVISFTEDDDLMVHHVNDENIVRWERVATELGRLE